MDKPSTHKESWEALREKVNALINLFPALSEVDQEMLYAGITDLLLQQQTLQQEVIEEIYTTGEYDFKNGSKINMLESGVFKEAMQTLQRSLVEEVVKDLRKLHLMIDLCIGRDQKYEILDNDEYKALITKWKQRLEDK
jgi:hypothetical protein